MAPELEDFYFQSDDRELVDGCVTALTRDGLNVAILASHAAVLDHYGSLLINRLRKFTPTSKVEVYFPTSSDDVLGRFNQTLANQSLAQAMQGRKNILATQFWVLNNASAIPEHELQLLASLVHNFPGANIRLILFLDTSRHTNPSLAAFGKNITRWDIALPSADQKETLMAQTKGHAQHKAVLAFLNRLSAPEPQLMQTTLVKKKFTHPFAKSQRSMAHQASPAARLKWTRPLQWALAAVVMLAASTGFLYGLYPSAFEFLKPADKAISMAPEKPSSSNSAKGKTTDSPVASKTSETKTADTGKNDRPSAENLTRAEAGLVDELPNEAAAGQAWAKKLPADSYVVQHLALPVFKNVTAWQQAHPKLADAHIVGIYKPGEKLAQFALVSGPFKSRSAAIEFTQQAQIPRLAFALPSPRLSERLSPSDGKARLKPKEPR
jgi:hypothetical protein